MEPLNFSEVMELVNRTGSTSISADPFKEESGKWALHKGSVRSGGLAFDFYVMCLLSDAVQESFKAARTALEELPKTTPKQVVYPPSLAEKYPRLRRSFLQITDNVLPLPEYFRSFLRQQVETYLTKIRDLTPAHYVHPQITVPRGVTRKTPNPVLSLLIDRDMGPTPTGAGAVGLLLAEPGQGKSFMSQYLAVNVVKVGLIPIYVHSEQWFRMQPEELSSIWKTIVHSFRFFEAPIGWAEGAERDFLKVALKAGLFRIIFDGFDEYVLWNEGSVDAVEAIENLTRLADETGARILVTSRTSFWETEVHEKDKESDIALTYRIEPFDQNHAENYFKERFTSDAKKTEIASRLFAELRSKTGDSAGFVGRGFFLYLVADLVDRGYKAHDLAIGGRSVTEWVMHSLCEREQTRQKLPVSADRQLDALTEFAVLTLSGEPPSSETLRLVFSASTELHPDQVDELVGKTAKSAGKLKDHPLIRRSGKSDWRFVQDQVEFALLAKRILALAESSEQHSTLLNFVGQKGFASTLQANVASAVVENIYEVSEPNAARAKISALVAALLSSGHFQISLGAAANPTSLATTIAVLANSREYPKGSDRSEKTERFLTLFPRKALRNLCFSGTLARFDFSGVTFEMCHFDQVTWASCRFDSATRFDSCRFTGGAILSCEGLGNAHWSDSCYFDRDALALVDAEKVHAGQRQYKLDDLRSDITALLRRFLPRDSAAPIRTVEERHLVRGQLGHSIHRDAILDAFFRHVLDKHRVSGMDGYAVHVREAAKAAVKTFATNGVFTGPLATAFEDLKKKLALR
jgi:hypothetical protein